LLYGVIELCIELYQKKKELRIENALYDIQKSIIWN